MSYTCLRKSFARNITGVSNKKKKRNHLWELNGCADLLLSFAKKICMNYRRNLYIILQMLTIRGIDTLVRTARKDTFTANALVLYTNIP